MREVKALSHYSSNEISAWLVWFGSALRMNATIRIATREDHAGWAELRALLFPECSIERHLLEIEMLAAGAGIVALALVDEEMVGFAEISIRRDHVEGTASAPVPYLEGWFVKEASRGQGIGRALMDFVEEWARGRGYTELASDAEVDNDKSIRLHGALGFRETGRSVHFVKPLKRDGS